MKFSLNSTQLDFICGLSSTDFKLNSATNKVFPNSCFDVLKTLSKIRNLYQRILLPFWLVIDEVRHSEDLKSAHLYKVLLKLGCLLAFPLKRSCDTTSKLFYSNSSFRAVFASISLSHFKCFVSWPSSSKTFIDSSCWTCVFLNNFIVLTLTISVVVWRKGLQKYLTWFAKYFQK